MNTRFKNFIFNGLTYGIVFLVLGFLLGYYTLKFPLRTAIFNSIPTAIVAFIIIGLVQSRFTKSSKSLEAITISLQDFESLKIAAPANHMIDDHLISGKLFLTDNRLVFKSFDQKEYSWLLNNLHSFKFHPSIFNPGGEFMIKDDSQNQLIFEVDEMKAWKRKLTNS